MARARERNDPYKSTVIIAHSVDKFIGHFHAQITA